MVQKGDLFSAEIEVAEEADYHEKKSFVFVYQQ